MSTFGGVMEEFPDIHVDFFRRIHPKPGQKAVPPALACFLSHVHSDHVSGLEAASFRGPFIYCSAATKVLLLRLEKYPHRLNFALGILEAQKIHFKHLKNLLKPIPLETPTRIELSPGNEIQVTLFDANHCTGAVMFLFEGNGKAVLYTGDIRSEPWFVNNLSRNPFLIEYVSGLKTLDCIYLDTSNTSDVPFPTKAAGLKELLIKVSEYPPDTVFHFEAWTFGYEEVWMALSKALKSQIHVDRYKLRLYQSLRGDLVSSGTNSGHILTHEGPVLAGFTCGNRPQEGCLTGDTNVRLHSCDKGMHCSEVNEKTVWIRPIIARHCGEELPEIGVGGGGGDLNQHPDLILNDEARIDDLMSLFADIEDNVKMDVKNMFLSGLGSTGRSIPLAGMDFDRDENELALTQMAKMMAASLRKRQRSNTIEILNCSGRELPKVITFPYSRHSSYQELCDLVEAFNPKDIYPCTVDEGFWIQEGINIKYLFGHVCTSKDFRHDREMRKLSSDQVSQVLSQQVQLIASQTPQEQMATSTSKVARQNRSVMDQVSTKSPEESLDLLISSIFDKGNVQGRLIPDHIRGSGSLDTSEIFDEVSLTQRIIALSPGSQSQNLRRKAIFDELAAHLKRPRLEVDGFESSPRGDSGSSNLVQPTATSSDSPKYSDAAESFGCGFDSDLSDDGIKMAIYDPKDQVFRCKLCANEIWGDDGGFCTGCEEGPGEMPYYEALDYDLMGYYRPDIVINEYTERELEGEERHHTVGDYLDDDSAAYDSQDSGGDHFHEEYEVGSFVVDSPSGSSNGADSNAENLSDNEEDIVAKYHELQASHTVLASDYCQLKLEYNELRMDVMGDDFQEDDDDERDEDGMIIIGVTEPRAVTTELIVSSAAEQPQGSVVSDERIRDRVEAFEAANSTDGRSWHDRSLISTTNNHTFPEVEL